MFILKLDWYLRLYVSRYPDDPRHYVSGDGTGDWCGLFQHRLHLSDGGERQEWRYRSIKNAGAKDGLIRAIFVWYGLLAGLFGSLCGVIIGVVVSLQLTPIIEWIEKLIGHQFLSSDIYFIDFLPSELHWLDVFYVLVTALLLSLFGKLVSGAARQ